METEKKDKRTVLGIDFGVKCSCVAVNIDGAVQVVKSRYQTSTIPSCVSFSDNGRDICVGYDADDQAISNPEFTIFDIKNILGKHYSDPQLNAEKNKWEFTLTNDSYNNPRVVVSKTDGHSKGYSIEQVASYVFSELKWMAEEFINNKPEFKFNTIDAVITVPVSFNKFQRQSIFDAATMAGLNILRIINEPTSAVFAYALPDKCDKKIRILVCNMSEARFDVSIVLTNGNECVVQASAEETTLNSQEFTEKLVNYCLEGLPSSIENDAVSIKRLKNACKQAVETLSSKDFTSIDIDCIAGGINFETEITREEFHDFADLTEKIIGPVNQVIKDSNMEKDKIDEVLLVGSGSWTPKAKLILNNYLEGIPIRCDIDPHEAIALGAATFGGNGTRFKITESVTPSLFKSSVNNLPHESLPILPKNNKFQSDKNVNETELDKTILSTSSDSDKTKFEANSNHTETINRKDEQASSLSLSGAKDKTIVANDKAPIENKAILGGNLPKIKEKISGSSALKIYFENEVAINNNDFMLNTTKRNNIEESCGKTAGPEHTFKPSDTSLHISTKVNKLKNQDDEPSSTGRSGTGPKKEFDNHNSRTFDSEFNQPKLFSELFKEDKQTDKIFKSQKEAKNQSLSMVNGKGITYPLKNGHIQSTAIACDKSIENGSKKICGNKNNGLEQDQGEILDQISSPRSNSFNKCGLTYGSETIQQRSKDELSHGQKYPEETQLSNQETLENESLESLTSLNDKPSEKKPILSSPFSELESNLDIISEGEVFEKVTLSVGVRLSSGESFIIIPKNSKLPHYFRMTFTTAVCYQRDFTLKFYAGERCMADDNFSLGSVHIPNIPPGYSGQHVFKLKFSLGNDGILKSEVFQPSSRFFKIGHINLELSKFKEYERELSLLNSAAIKTLDEDLKKKLELRHYLVKVLYYFVSYANSEILEYQDKLDFIEVTSRTISEINKEGNKTNKKYVDILTEVLKVAHEIFKSNDMNITSIEKVLPNFKVEPTILGTGKTYW